MTDSERLFQAFKNLAADNVLVKPTLTLKVNCFDYENFDEMRDDGDIMATVILDPRYTLELHDVAFLLKVDASTMDASALCMREKSTFIPPTMEEDVVVQMSNRHYLVPGGFGLLSHLSVNERDEIDALMHACYRVLIVGNMNITVKRSVCLITGSNCDRIVMFQRSSENQDKASLTVLNMSCGAVKKTMFPWFATKFFQEPNFFFFNDWFVINSRLVAQCDHTNGICGVAHVEKELCENYSETILNVYKVFVPLPECYADPTDPSNQNVKLIKTIDLNASEWKSVLVEVFPDFCSCEESVAHSDTQALEEVMPRNDTEDDHCVLAGFSSSAGIKFPLVSSSNDSNDSLSE
jgi:hypothetical protein